MIRQLRAGRLVADYDQGVLRYIRIGSAEAIRRVYMAVRDRNWNTVPARILREHIIDDASSFRIDFDAEHRDGEIAFRWHGRYRGARDRIELEMDGQALSSFWKNRIGFCVLHPGNDCAGRPCTVTHSDGSHERGCFPVDVSPRQPFLDVRAIAHECAPGLAVSVSFEGDTFEIEDQRNWTDDSFKTYSTPLWLPYPARVEPGHRVRQRVVVEVSLDTGAPAACDDAAAANAPPVVEIGDALIGPLPAIGFGDPGRPLADGAVERLRALRPRHLRADLRLDEDGWPARLAQAAANAKTVGAGLEIAAHVCDPAALAALREVRARRWLVYDRDRHSSLPDTVNLARTVLRRPVVAGTNANFAELNRNREGALAADALCYAVNCQVHGDDEYTMLETLGGQAATVRSALAIGGRRPVVVSPVTLRPRFNAVATSGAPAAPDPDPRQREPFLAAWTLGSLSSLVQAGAASLTYFEAAGPLGVVADDGAPYPVYAVFERISEFAPDGFASAVCSQPLRAAALALVRGDITRAVVANLTPEPLDVLVRFDIAAEAVRLAPYALVHLDR